MADNPRRLQQLADVISTILILAIGQAVSQRTPAIENAVPAAEPGVEEKFNEAYQLKEGEYLKLVPEPFLPERNDFIAARFPGGNEKSVQMLVKGGALFLESDGKNVRYHTMITTEAIREPEPGQRANPKRVPLRSVIAACTGRLTPEVVFDVRTNNHVTIVEGDFVIRRDAPLEKLLPDFQKALDRCRYDENEKPPFLSIREEMQEVYVVRGKLAISPRKDRNKDEVDIFADERVRNGDYTLEKPKINDEVFTSHDRVTATQLLRKLGSFIDRRIVADTVLPDEPLLTAYIHYRWEEKATPIQQADDRDPDKVLKNVSDQLGLTFKKEMRTVKILYVGVR